MLNYTTPDMQAIVSRHRQLNAAAHRRYVGIGFVIGAALVCMIWLAAL